MKRRQLPQNFCHLYIELSIYELHPIPFFLGVATACTRSRECGWGLPLLHPMTVAHVHARVETHCGQASREQ